MKIKRAVYNAVGLNATGYDLFTDLEFRKGMLEYSRGLLTVATIIENYGIPKHTLLRRRKDLLIILKLNENDKKILSQMCVSDEQTVVNAINSIIIPTKGRPRMKKD